MISLHSPATQNNILFIYGIALCRRKCKVYFVLPTENFMRQRKKSRWGRAPLRFLSGSACSCPHNANRTSSTARRALAGSRYAEARSSDILSKPYSVTRGEAPRSHNLLPPVRHCRANNRPSALRAVLPHCPRSDQSEPITRPSRAARSPAHRPLVREHEGCNIKHDSVELSCGFHPAFRPRLRARRN